MALRTSHVMSSAALGAVITVRKQSQASSSQTRHREKVHGVVRQGAGETPNCDASHPSLPSAVPGLAASSRYLWGWQSARPPETSPWCPCCEGLKEPG